MTVIVTLNGGGTDEYMRYHDSYVKHSDGTLDVVRSGAKRPYSYAPGVWSHVTGDEKTWKTGRFGG
jgi:hypothetical protein